MDIFKISSERNYYEYVFRTKTLKDNEVEIN